MVTEARLTRCRYERASTGMMLVAATGSASAKAGPGAMSTRRLPVLHRDAGTMRRVKPTVGEFPFECARLWGTGDHTMSIRGREAFELLR